MANDYGYLEQEIQNYFNKIKERIVALFQEAIQKTIYDYSDPIKTWYDRTGQFKDAVDIKFEGTKLIVYVNTDKLNYYSWVNFSQTDKEVSEIVPWLLEEGHHSDKSNQYGLYKNYNGRGYLEMAQEMIRQEFPDLITIINDEPQF